MVQYTSVLCKGQCSVSLYTGQVCAREPAWCKPRRSLADKAHRHQHYKPHLGKLLTRWLCFKLRNAWDLLRKGGVKRRSLWRALFRPIQYVSMKSGDEN